MPESEIWLRGNRRAFVVGSLLPAVFGIVGLIGALDLFPFSLSITMRLAAGILALLSILVGIAMAHQARLPRLAYAEEELLVYAGASKPFRVPIEVVEVFFGGQGETDVQVPGENVQARNVVVRLAERDKQWHARQLRRSFGRWKDGYISINGAWCEPINVELIKALNHKLVVTKRGLRKRENAAQESRTTGASGGDNNGQEGAGA